MKFILNWRNNLASIPLFLLIIILIQSSISANLFVYTSEWNKFRGKHNMVLFRHLQHNVRWGTVFFYLKKNSENFLTTVQFYFPEHFIEGGLFENHHLMVYFWYIICYLLQPASIFNAFENSRPLCWVVSQRHIMIGFLKEVYQGQIG